MLVTLPFVIHFFGFMFTSGRELASVWAFSALVKTTRSEAGSALATVPRKMLIRDLM